MGFLFSDNFWCKKIQKTWNQILNQFKQFGITLLRWLPTQFQEIKENY